MTSCCILTKKNIFSYHFERNLQFREGEEQYHIRYSYSACLNFTCVIIYYLLTTLWKYAVF